MSPEILKGSFLLRARRRIHETVIPGHLVGVRGYSSFDVSTYLHLTSHRARRRVVEIGFVLMLRVPEHTIDAVALFLSPRALNSENHSIFALRRSADRFHFKENSC